MLQPKRLFKFFSDFLVIFSLNMEVVTMKLEDIVKKVVKFGAITAVAAMPFLSDAGEYKLSKKEVKEMKELYKKDSEAWFDSV